VPQQVTQDKKQFGKPFRNSFQIKIICLSRRKKCRNKKREEGAREERWGEGREKIWSIKE
jgi:hypothetical protein